MNANNPNPKMNNAGEAIALPAINLTAAVQSFPLPRAENVIYEHHKGCYWTPDTNGRWIRYSREAIRLRLRQTLYLDGTSKDGLPAEVDVELDRIAQEQSVDVALSLAGYMAGLHTVLGSPILVTASPSPLLPVEGNHNRFLARVRRMFGTEQAELFCGWLKYALSDYYEFLTQQTGRNVGMALVVSGSSGLGKTLLLDLLTECFGGRRGQPAQYAKGGTGFNNDLIAKELQVFDDDGMGDAYRERKEMGDLMKRMVAVRDQRCHPKGKDAIMVRVFWRLIFCLNDEAENLQVLPPLERGVQDKLMMLKATGALLDEAEEHHLREKNWSMLLEEIAWFIHWLVNEFEPNKTLLDARFGMRAWHHLDLVDGVDSLAPQSRLLDMVMEREDLFTAGEWKGTARELEVKLKLDGTNTAREAQDLLKSSGSTGKYLSKLAAKQPDRVMRIGRGKVTSQLWKIAIPEKHPVETGSTR